MLSRGSRLSAIRADERAQPRAALDDDRVAEYAEDMKRGCRLPPPVVFEDLERVYWLADGFHRHRAAVALKRKTIECIVYQGELRDAVLHGCGANAGHGLRRSNQDKRRAVARMLDDEEWSHWTDREIARRCKVGHDLVARLRREQLESVTSGNASEPRTYTNKHGTTSTMNTANIGRKPGKPEASGAERASPAANDEPDDVAPAAPELAPKPNADVVPQTAPDQPAHPPVPSPQTEDLPNSLMKAAIDAQEAPGQEQRIVGGPIIEQYVIRFRSLVSDAMDELQGDEMGCLFAALGDVLTRMRRASNGSDALDVAIARSTHVEEESSSPNNMLREQMPPLPEGRA
jgi:hypothetical protein